ncbi:MAG: tRNA (adenosine(37)-N6)-threonylcarbamoyltransferase complex ATPase subunit type 1 TsaE [Anaerotruncus sp.]|jgi:tRNA threonylcarbamoyladenosine biosynthesis protein TsaE|nr:tRNA (adenosine(37)-N6)-threonylcarbamoyltransferase complex ATPase subunit type 1 TsaE [Anaerotruncus sp.]
MPPDRSPACSEGAAVIRFTSHSAEETEQFAEQFAKRLRPGDVIACFGGMGMGKTVFAHGLARGLGLSDEVSSPTFALVQEYTDGNIPLYHFDMYRVSDFDSLYSTGFFDYLEQDGVLLIEWSEQIESALPPGAIRLSFARLDDNTRELTIEGEEI